MKTPIVLVFKNIYCWSNEHILVELCTLFKKCCTLLNLFLKVNVLFKLWLSLSLSLSHTHTHTTNTQFCIRFLSIHDSKLRFVLPLHPCLLLTLKPRRIYLNTNLNLCVTFRVNRGLPPEEEEEEDRPAPPRRQHCFSIYVNNSKFYLDKWLFVH